MAPEKPPFAVVLDTRLEGDELAGIAEYYDSKHPIENVRVRWGFGEPPSGYESAGSGVIFVADHVKRPPDPRAPVEDLGDGRYSYFEGLGDADHFMLVMLLPQGKTLDQPQPRPASARSFGDRLAVYWILPAGADRRAGVVWKLRPIEADLKAEVRALKTSGRIPLDREWSQREHDIFLSYRRDDSRWPADRIDKRLVEHFDRDGVFRDTKSIPAGQDFRKVLDEAVGRCRVMLVVIGPRFTGCEDLKRRLEDEKDFVRIEIESALQRDMPVIPLLLDDAKLEANDLPESLSDLAFRQGVSVRVDSFDEDMSRLVKLLEDMLPPEP